MRFKVGDLVFPASVVESDQTGLTIQFRAPKPEMHEQLLVEVLQRERGGVFALADKGEPESEWRVKDSGFTYVGSEPWGMHHHTWRIEQVERLSIESLVLGPLTLEPYEYREAADDDGTLQLSARAAVSDEQLHTLASLHTCDVTRVGISPEPRPMRIRGYLWGRRGDRGLAVALVCSDVSAPRVTLERGMTGVEDPLEHLLIERGVLDRAELQQRRHAARRVDDVDGWAL
jgi:hypothetical protein